MPSGKDVAEKRPYERMIEHLTAIAELDGSDSFEIAANVIDEIGKASSLDEIFAANESGPTDVAEYLGTPLNMYEARFFKSAEQFRQGTLGVYCVFKAYTDKNDDVMLSVGAPNVVAAIYQMMQLHLFGPDNPVRFVIRGRPTAKGTLYTVHSA
jgi:hypothetical protein